MGFRYNTLVLSDIHLGEDLSPAATQTTRHNIDVLEQQLVSFLRHYTRQRRDGRPWRLVFNGDLIDFISICLNRDDTADEAALGLERTPRIARDKVAAIAEHRAEFFRALARFLSRGNRLEVISGNHDTEFHWPTTQSAFRHVISDAWDSLAESRREGAPTGADIAASIDFHPWFFRDRGVWIEHGHQYDECCSLDHQLYPRTPNTDEIVLNVDAAGTRYITCRVPDAEQHMQEEWSLTGYLRWGWDIGLRRTLRLLRAYLAFSVALLRVWKAHTDTRGRLKVEAEHQQRLCGLAERWGMSERQLMSLDNLRRRPVVGHLRRLMAVLMLDKLLAYGGAVVITVAALVLVAAPWNVGLAAAAWGGARALTWWTGRGRAIDCGIDLARASGKIASSVDARIVVFGHTHRPVAQKLESGAWYFNTGTWVPNGRPGLLRAFTHLVIRHTDSGPIASLCQWRDGASRAFTPDWGPAGIPDAVEVPIPNVSEPKPAEAA